MTLLSSHDQLGQALSEMTNTLRGVITQINAIATGDYTQELKPLSVHDQLGKALSDMTKRLREITTQNDQQSWIKTGQTQINDKLSGEQNIMQIAENVMNFLTPYVEAQVGVFYLAQGKGPMMRLKMMASYAYTWRKKFSQ
ncbi:two-component system sensory histidine kinase [Beggiatoa sp. PS]|nr:two-component system sensory histidine kinase [Beggiatoa sp. PS]